MKATRDLVLILLGWLWVIIAPFVNDLMLPGKLTDFVKAIDGNYWLYLVFAMPFIVFIGFILYIRKVDKIQEARDKEPFNSLNAQIGTLNGNILSMRDEMHRDSTTNTEAIRELLLEIRKGRENK